jgi:hypothetical protein
MPKGRNGRHDRLIKKCRERGKRVQTQNNTAALRRTGLPVKYRVIHNTDYDNQYEYHKRLPEVVTLSKMYENVMGDIKRGFSPLDVAMYTYNSYTYEGYDKNEVVRAIIKYLQQ